MTPDAAQIGQTNDIDVAGRLITLPDPVDDRDVVSLRQD
jgi:hypothetical protein